MKRDNRLLIVMLLFAVSLISLAIQAVIVNIYVSAAVLGNWTYFAETFSVNPPGKFCLDYCAPHLPFVMGWIGIAAFVIGWIILARVWWKPRS